MTMQFSGIAVLFLIFVIFSAFRWGHWYHAWKEEHWRDEEEARERRHRELIEKLDEIKNGIIDVESITETICEITVKRSQE